MTPATPEREELDSEVLGWLLDDFENATTLAGDIALTLGTPVAESAVAAALERLSHAGLADRYLFDESSGKYVVAPESSRSSTHALWYLASSHGRMVAGT